MNKEILKLILSGIALLMIILACVKNEEQLTPKVETIENIDMESTGQGDSNNNQSVDTIATVIYSTIINGYEIISTSISRLNKCDYYPKRFNQGILFSSINKEERSPLGVASSKIYYSEMAIKEVLTTPIEIKVDFKSRYHFGAAEYVPKSKEIFFSTNDTIESSNRIKNLCLFRGYLVNDEIVDIEKLKFCDPEYNFSHPTISDDGLTLIFSSNIDGQFKLYEAKRNFIDEEWFDITLIDQINGSYIAFPNLLNDSTLVYSKEVESKELDIFISKKIDGKWIEVNEWFELNSDFDDFGVELMDSTNGYFTSNRIDTIDRIFYFNVD